MGATIAKGAIGLALGLAILIGIVVVAVAYLPGAEQLLVGMTNQIVSWAHQLHGTNTQLRSPVGPAGTRGP